MKLVSILGIEKGDYAYYLASALKALKSTVLVIDNSLHGDLFYSITRNNEEAKNDKMLEFENIVFIRGLEYKQETFEKFDYVVCFNGWNKCDETVFNSDHVYIMPNYHLYSLDLTKEKLTELEPYFGNKEDSVSIIMRDLVSEKITDLSVASYINTNVENIIGHITLDISDHAKQIAFEYNGVQSLKGLSLDYIDALTYALVQTTSISDKSIRKLLKKL